jgi:glutathione S-transferase
MAAVQPIHPIRLYRNPISGHAHRIELFLSLLGIPVELINVDLKGGAHKTPEFLQKNSLGQVPVIEDGEITLSDSNAILVYLATKYGDPCWLPRDAHGAALVQRYLSLVAGEIAQGPALARKINLLQLPLDIVAPQAVAKRLFAFLDSQLTTREFLTGANPTIADVACYSYIARAPEGGISLAEYVNLRRWLERIEALPRFVPMQINKIGLVV